MCKKYGHFPTLFSDVLKAEGPNDSNNGEAKLESITILEAEQHAKTLASCWPGKPTHGLVLLFSIAKGGGNADVIHCDGGINSDGLASGKPSPKLYRDGGPYYRGWIRKLAWRRRPSRAKVPPRSAHRLVRLLCPRLLVGLRQLRSSSRPVLDPYGIMVCSSFKDKVLELFAKTKNNVII